MMNLSQNPETYPLTLRKIIFVLLWIVSAAAAHAEVIFDGTMNPGSLGVGLKGNFQISEQYGKTVGRNLFHSFKTFNINTGETATFTGSNTIQNIISRVTGGSGTYINGALNSGITGANLYLLNPAGVMFGPSASLNLTGSFHVSTANYLKMETGEEFHVSASDPILSASEPKSFGFLDNSFGKISVDGAAKLNVKTGKTLSMIGGNIEIKRGKISAPQGRINMASTGSACEIALTDSGISGIGNTRGQITITDNSQISVNGEGSGNIFITGGNFYLSNLSKINATTSGDKSGGAVVIDVNTLKASGESEIDSPHMSPSMIDKPYSAGTKGGDIVITASDSVEFSENCTIRAYALSMDSIDKSCHSGNITIKAKNVSFVGNTQINSSSDQAGKGGNISIYAAENAIFSDNSVISTTTNSGEAGNILIDAKKISFVNNSGPSSQTYGEGKGGDILLRAAQSLTLSGNDNNGYAAIITSYATSSGNAGDIRIEAANVSLSDGARLSAVSKGTGSGGNISILAPGGTIQLNGINPYGENLNGLGSGVSSRSESEESSAGKAGNISIRTGILSISNGALITNSTKGGGDSGSVSVVADRIEIHGDASANVSLEPLQSQQDFTGPSEGYRSSGIYSRSESPIAYDKPGGEIAIRASDLSISNQGTITTSGTGARNAGNINIQVIRLNLSETASIASEATSASHGASAGKITVNAGDAAVDSVILRQNSTITTSSAGAGDAGEILLETTKLDLDSESEISSASQGKGSAGRITVRAKNAASDSIMLKNGAGISTSCNGEGNAGGIELSTVQLDLQTGALIASSSNSTGSGGNAGTILIHAGTSPSNRIVLENKSLITTSSSGNGNAGAITLNAYDLSMESQSKISSLAQGAGNAGTIAINPGGGSGKKMTLRDRAEISTSCESSGSAGAILVNADELSIDAAKITSESLSEGLGGSGGTIDIQAGSIGIRSTGRISTSTNGKGTAGDIMMTTDQLDMASEAVISSASNSKDQGDNAGSIDIRIENSLMMNSNSSITTEARSGGGGKISLYAGNTIYPFNCEITSSVKQGEGHGGDITLSSKYIILNHSSVTANAIEGDGGAIFIYTDNYIRSADSKVTATSERGNDGTVQIIAPNLNLVGTLTVLPSNLLDAARWMKTPCAARLGENVSRLVIWGKDAVLTSHNDLLASPVTDEKD